MARRKNRSQVRFARVPAGGETCPFCLMLASRGFVYHSAQNAGDDGHYHAHCRCRIVPSWGSVGVEGYNPAELYDRWKHPEKYARAKAITSVDGLFRSVGADYNEQYAAWHKRASMTDLNYIKWDVQNRHFRGTKEYEKALAQRGVLSYFTITPEELSDLIKVYASHGQPVISHAGYWGNKEVCTTDKVIGYTYSKTGVEEPTRAFTIHYKMDGGLHAVPKFDMGEVPDDIR